MPATKNRPQVSAAAELKEARRRRRETALSLRPQMSPVAPAPDHFRVATWNVNSLRARTPALTRFLERARPDVVCLQETKAAAVAPAAAEMFDRLGYTVVHAGAGAYNGVAIASLHSVDGVIASEEFDDELLDREPRLISCIIHADQPVRVASVYVPHGREVGHWHYEYKLGFLAALQHRVSTWLQEGSLIVGGDLNVAPTDSDIFHPDAFIGLTHVTQPERNALVGLLAAGLVDLDASQWGPRERRFTWWANSFSYERNLGMRIDMLAADARLSERLTTTWIDHIERGGERPSDHAALIADFERQTVTSPPR
jgi:exodeoxyribonuclease-3